MNWKIILSSIAASALVACGGSDTGGGGATGGTLVLTSSKLMVKADGLDQTIIHVDGSQKGPITVRTDRGRFLETGVNVAQGNATPFDVTLISCDSRITSGCAGNALVSASDQNLASNRIQVLFVAVEICNNGVDDDGDGLIDCADPDCAGQTCSATGKTCSAASPSTCACPSGQATETPAQCGAAVPLDNDCDGKAGCADSDCTGRTCSTGTLGSSGSPLFGTCKMTNNVGSCTCVSTQGTKETSCGDGLDNDCDGLIDCDDPDCQSKAGQPGQFCDAARPGMTCSNPAATGGTSTCSVCAPNRNFALAQPTETTCNDGIDNDCDGQIDCGDSDCVSRAAVCSANGERCTTALQCRCPDTSGVETICDDGQDNDCDGKKDCADSDCAGRTCGPNGKTCSGGVCTCPGGQVKETSCGDGLDNDCDGLIDCADPDCRATSAGAYGQACATGTLVANARCDYFGACVCPGGQAKETSCGDGLDNDCDGKVDCEDPDCAGQSCGTFGKTCPAVGTTCSCPTGTTEICDDGKDNNCDGKVDCDDPGCANAACLVGAPTYLCRQSGTGTTYFCKDTSNYILTVTAVPTRIPADGLATSAVTAFLQDGTTTPPTAIPSATVTFTPSLGAVSPTSATTATSGTSQGKATVTFTAPTGSGAAAITAQYSYAGGSAFGSTTITLPQLSQINLSNQQYTVLGARNSGYQESSELTFALVDSTNQPYPAGLTVLFEHAPLGESFIGASPSCTVTLCTASGQTDSAGKVKVILHSGRTAGVVSVVAKAEAGGSGLKTYTAGNIAIVAARASGAQITLNCSPRNIPALIDQDGTNSNYAGSDAQPRCTVTLADRYGQVLGVATVATFESEAGIVGPPAITPAYPAANLGVASTTVKVTGGKLPVDVAPWTLAGEYSLVHNWDGFPAREHNPRDGLVTVIVKVRGEEGFVDGSNGCPRDGVYQGPGSGIAGCDAARGENFIDLGEPFVDSNDNGFQDGSEPYDDVNGNGVWDGPNGVWDADTTIWAQARILYTDYVVPRVLDGLGLERASRTYGSGSPPAATPVATFSVRAAVPAQPGPPPVPAQPATSGGVNLFFTDTNFNVPNSKYAYAVAKQPSTASMTTAFTAGGAPTTIDTLGMTFTQLYCNSQTPADKSTDCSNQCNWAPCYPIIDLTQFVHGAHGSVGVTGGTTPDGGVCVTVTGSLTTTGPSGSTTVNTPIQVCGTSN
jgi:hypothetical protein